MEGTLLEAKHAPAKAVALPGLLAVLPGNRMHEFRASRRASDQSVEPRSALCSNTAGLLQGAAQVSCEHRQPAVSLQVGVALSKQEQQEPSARRFKHFLSVGAGSTILETCNISFVIGALLSHPAGRKYLTVTH